MCPGFESLLARHYITYLVDVVQLVERQIVVLVVEGSSPFVHPIFSYRGIAKSVRHQILILAFRRFESCYPCHFYQAEKTEKTKHFT